MTSFSGTIAMNAASLGGRAYLSGATTSVLIWPSSILPPTYRLFHIAKYNNGARRRIFTGYSTGADWLSGFWEGITGVAYHGDWLTPYTAASDCCGYNWMLSTDQNGLYRSNGVLKSTSAGYSGYSQLAVNSAGSSNGAAAIIPSDWAIAAAIVFNRTLSSAEITMMENWLSQLYGLTATVSAPYPPSPPPAVSTGWWLVEMIIWAVWYLFPSSSRAQRQNLFLQQMSDLWAPR